MSGYEVEQYRWRHHCGHVVTTETYPRLQQLQRQHLIVCTEPIPHVQPLRLRPVPPPPEAA